MSNTETTKPETRKTLATITNTNANVWHVASQSGQQLAVLTGIEAFVLSAARASLIADQGLAEGEWVRRGPGRFSYVVLT